MNRLMSYFFRSLVDTNPVSVLVLGVCALLPATGTLSSACLLALGVLLVTAFSSLALSALRKVIPDELRVMAGLLSVLFFATLFSLVAGAKHEALSPYIGLLAANGVILGRLDAYALKRKPLSSFVDALIKGTGYAAVLIASAFVRELAGSGRLFGMQVIPDSWYLASGGGYADNYLMLLPVSALLLIAVVIWIQHTPSQKGSDRTNLGEE